MNIKFLSLALLPFVMACNSFHDRFIYPINPPIAVINRSPPDVSIALASAEDQRELENSRTGVLWAWVPLVPYGTFIYNRPESGGAFIALKEFRMNAAKEIPRAIAKHLEDSGVAKIAYFDDTSETGASDYILKTRIIRTRYEGRVMSYGLSLFGLQLRYYGPPAGRSRVDVKLILDLYQRGNENPIWRQTISGVWTLWPGAYYNMGRDMDGLAIVMQRELDRILRKHPLPLAAAP